MFAQNDIRTHADQFIKERWKSLYATRRIRYEEQSKEETIEIYDGTIHPYNQDKVLHPVRFWIHSAMLSLGENSVLYSNSWPNNRDEQDKLLRSPLILDALCKPISPQQFYSIYDEIVAGRLPLALAQYNPVTVAMEMWDEWNYKAYIAEAGNTCIGLYWDTTA